MLNTADMTEVPLGIFAGNNTELSPTDLPAGLSPASCDVAFLPGSVFTRPALRQYSALGSTNQIVYAKSFVTSDGKTHLFEADSAGQMFSDGVKIGQTAAGNRFVVENVFGKAYIAISDGSKGVDVPLHFDGVNLDRVSQGGPGAPPTVSDSSISSSVLTSLSRANGYVTATASTATSLSVGSRFSLSNVAPQIVALSQIVINNVQNPGVATITTPTAHKLQPGDVVTLTNVGQAFITTITSYGVTNGLQTVHAPAHGLQAGDLINIVTSAGTNNFFTILNVLDVDTFTFLTNGANNTGTVSWPLYLRFPSAETAEGNQYTISTVPSATTFQIPITYGDGTWTSGTLSYEWNGTFYVSSIVSPTVFTYQQFGPDGSSSSGGTITPQGQIAPGARGVACVFQLRDGTLTQPSPTFTWFAGGGQSASTTLIPIGPSTTVARIMIFTGANGGNYFYLPAAPKDPTYGYLIGTSTVVPDNTTTSATFDFTDEALFAGNAVDQPGNNLFRLQVLDSALGFYSYKSRLATWGQRNVMPFLLNMGFEGGVQASAPNVPLGWTVTGAGALVAGDYGLGWQPTGSASLAQSVYQNQRGTAIALPNTKYTLRGWTTGTITATLSSALTGFSSTATVTASSAFGEAAFSVPTPASIPSDLTLTITGSGIMDELYLYYTAQPYNTFGYLSYINNPGSFDGVTGKLGSATDPHPILGMKRRGQVLNVLTSGPKGSLYETEDTASGEPSTWDFNLEEPECGLSSVWGWETFGKGSAWISDTGLRVYFGGDVEKISQEVQTVWDSYNPAYKQLSFLCNDPYNRRFYIGGCKGTNVVPQDLDVLDYRELNTAAILASSGTLRVGLSGKTITTDLTRKWTRWTVQANYAALISLSSGGAQTVFCGGAGASLSVAAHSALYRLEEGVISGIDDDYGPFWQTSTYPTYFFVADDQAEQLKLNGPRLFFGYLNANLQGQGKVFWKIAANRVDNIVKTTRAVPVTPDLARDRGWGIEVATERVSFALCVQPAITGGLAGFNLSSLSVWATGHDYSPVAGWNK